MTRNCRELLAYTIRTRNYLVNYRRTRLEKP